MFTLIAFGFGIATGVAYEKTILAWKARAAKAVKAASEAIKN